MHKLSLKNETVQTETKETGYTQENKSSYYI